MLCAAACCCTISNSADASELRRTAVVKAVEEVRDSVVNIHGQKTLTPTEDPQARIEGPRKVNGMGTGVVVDERGYIITNFHVVDGVKKIEVTLANGDDYVAQLVSTDPVNDLAMVKVNVPQKLPVIHLGTSSDLMVGESVIAVGNAFGYEHTVTRGIVSALHRSVQVSDTQSYEDLIQTDASINPGNSGGPLLNIDGEMIGLNVAVRAGATGIGFAIPVDKAMGVAAKLISVERVEHKWHGVKASDTPGRTDGVVISTVDEDSPASKGGLRPGDLITAVGKQQVSRSLDFERALLGHDVGDDVNVTVRRNNQPVTLHLALADLPQNATSSEDASWELLGLKLQQIPQQQFRQLQTRYRGGLSVVCRAAR